MFAVRGHKYAVREHVFSLREHKYAGREHKKPNRIKTNCLLVFVQHFGKCTVNGGTSSDSY